MTNELNSDIDTPSLGIVTMIAMFLIAFILTQILLLWFADIDAWFSILIGVIMGCVFCAAAKFIDASFEIVDF